MGNDAPPGRALLAALPERARELAPRLPAIEAALDRAYAAGRAAWGLDLDPARFARHVAERVRADSDVPRAIPALHTSDLFLACACCASVPGAIAALERVHLARVPLLVGRIDRSPAFADEVAQAVREALLVTPPGRPAGIAGYSGRGALSSFIRVVAVRIALRVRRERRAAPVSRDPLADRELAGVVDPELDYLKVRYRGVYEDAIAAALASLPDRDALLLSLHYVDGLDIDRIGALLGVHRATVARWRAAARRRVLENVRARLRDDASMTPSDFASVLAIVRSQLAVSVRAALRRPRASP